MKRNSADTLLFVYSIFIVSFYFNKVIIYFCTRVIIRHFCTINFIYIPLLIVKFLSFFVILVPHLLYLYKYVKNNLRAYLRCTFEIVLLVIQYSSVICHLPFVHFIRDTNPRGSYGLRLR